MTCNGGGNREAWHGMHNISVKFVCISSIAGLQPRWPHAGVAHHNAFCLIAEKGSWFSHRRVTRARSFYRGIWRMCVFSWAAGPGLRQGEQKRSGARKARRPRGKAGSTYMQMRMCTGVDMNRKSHSIGCTYNVGGLLCLDSGQRVPCCSWLHDVMGFELRRHASGEARPSPDDGLVVAS